MPVSVIDAAGVAADGKRRRRSSSARRHDLRPVAESASLIFCHWSIERMRCAGAARSRPDNRSVAGSRERPRHLLGRQSWMCGCDVSTRWMKLACRPASIADMKTMTRDADRDGGKDEQRLHSPFAQEAQRRDPLEGSHGSWLAVRRRRERAPSRPLRSRCRRQHQFAGLQALEDFRFAGADQSSLHGWRAGRRRLHLQDPRLRRVAGRGCSSCGAMISAPAREAVSMSTETVISCRR